MPRKARIDYPGLTHHVMAKTFVNQKLFKDTEDRERYLAFFTKRIKEGGFLCYAWALMDNHVHFLVKTSEKPLWKLMKPFHGDYARYFNKKYDRTGPLFIDRFKSIATQDQNYLLEILRYIHLNPIRAGVCKNLVQLKKYRWTGHAALMGRLPNDFQTLTPVYRRFGKTKELARKKYEQYLLEGIASELPEESSEFINLIRLNNIGRKDKHSPHSWVIGDAEFQKTVIQKAEANRLAICKYAEKGYLLNEVLGKVSRLMKVDKQNILKKSKRTRAAEARKVFCYYACSLQFPTRQTGQYLGIQQAAVTNAARLGEMILKKENLPAL